MDIETVKKLIVGQWDIVTRTQTFGFMDRYTFDNGIESRKTSNHIKDHYTQDYSIVETLEGIFLQGKMQREIYALSEKCMVWLKNDVLEILLRKQ